MAGLQAPEIGSTICAGLVQREPRPTLPQIFGEEDALPFQDASKLRPGAIWSSLARDTPPGGSNEPHSLHT